MMVFTRDLCQSNNCALFQSLKMAEPAPRMKPVFGAKSRQAVHKPGGDVQGVVKPGGEEIGVMKPGGEVREVKKPGG